MTDAEKRRAGGALVWTCPICGTSYTPRPGHRWGKRQQKTCLQRACVVEQRRRHCVGVPPVEAIFARKDAKNAAMYDRFRNAFGDLTAREQRLFRAVYRFAYERGYQSGCYARRKATKQRAAA